MNKVSTGHRASFDIEPANWDGQVPANWDSQVPGEGTHDGDDDLAQNKRIVRMALLANFFMFVGQTATFSLGPPVYLQLDEVSADCPAHQYPIDADLRNCVAGAAGELTGNLAALNAAFEFLSAGALGMLSDNFGRKPFLISSAVGIVFDLSALTFAAGGTPGGTTLMYLARATAGALGNQEIFIRAALADVSTSDEAPKNFGMILMNFGLGLLVSVVCGTVATHVTGSIRGGTGFAVLSTMLAVFVLLAMPEPLAKRHRKPVQWSLANPFGAMLFLFSTRYFSLFAVMSLVDKTANSLCFSNLAIFCIAVFGEDAQFAVLLLFCGVLIGIICSVFLPPILRVMGVLNTVKLGYILTSCGFVCVALITPLRVFAYMFAALSVFALGTISGPTQTSIATLCVDQSQQGTLQGAVGSIEVVGRVIGPFTGAQVWKYAARSGHFTYLWWAGAILMIPGVVIAFILPRALPAHIVRQLSGDVGEFIKTQSINRRSRGSIIN